MDSSKQNVAVLFGGKSPEHEISIITGIQVLNNIDREKFNAFPIYVAKDGSWYYSDVLWDLDVFKNLDMIPHIASEVYLSPTPNQVKILGKNRGLFGGQLKINIDVFMPCFHGNTGENGSFQGLLEICEKPYVGSEVLGSSACMDKVITKQILTASEVKTAEYLYFSREEVHKDINQVASKSEKTFGYPLFVKPAVGGSSVGVTKAKNLQALKDGLELAAAFDSKVLVEKSIENAKEINVSVLGNTGSELKVSSCEEVFHGKDFLTYDDKYKGEGGKSKGMASTKRNIPADISTELTLSIQQTAKKVFEALNCFGLARIDFLVKPESNEIYVIEVNTIPGSMAFYLWEASGVSFKNLISNLVQLAFERHSQKTENINTFSTNVLKDFKGNLKSSKLGPKI